MLNSWMGGAGGHFHPSQHQRFEEQYHCYPLDQTDKAALEKGDKIILPPSAFDTLARLHVDYPMLFQLFHHHAHDSTDAAQSTHCGVLEFTAEEGCVYIPSWMFITESSKLALTPGALVTIRNVSLPKASHCVLQPATTAFLQDLSNPRAVLEHCLRHFSCLTVHDVIPIPYNGVTHQLTVVEVEPSPAACIIETDCRVDFRLSPEQQAEFERQAATKKVKAEQLSNGAAKPEASAEEEEVKKPGIRIVNGQIVRPEDDDNGDDEDASTAMVAPRTGATGVQRNAAIPVAAPPIDYWATAAQKGQRLDGKAAAPVPSTPRSAATTEDAAPAKRRQKSRVGHKYSRLTQKTSAFQGSANSFGEK